MSRLGAYCRSAIGSFVRSVLGARSCPVSGCPPLILGGCCTYDDTGWGCVQDVTETWCFAMGGRWKGFAVPCDHEDCFPPSVQGNCCIVYRSPSGGFCRVGQCAGISRGECAALEGMVVDFNNCTAHTSFQPLRTYQCLAAGEIPVVGNPAFGVCAGADFERTHQCCTMSNCTEQDLDDCLSLSGMWLGKNHCPNTVPCLGSCCIGQCGWCVDRVTSFQCAQLTGSTANWTRGSLCQSRQCA